MNADVAIIGAGITGCAVAYECAKYDLRIAVLEKNNDAADETTKANSAIIHAGYDPEPGTNMARCNVRGNALAKELCGLLSVPYRQIGSLVLSFTPEEDETVRGLFARGCQNGVPGLRVLSRDEVLTMEPNLGQGVRCALYAPTAAIVSPWEYAIALLENAVENGCLFYPNSPVTQIRRLEQGYELTAGAHTVRARYVVNAAGVYADAVHNLAAPPRFTIKPNKGQYYLLDKSEGGLVSHVVFQCPSQAGKGVLVSPTVHGNLIVGPNAEDAPSRADVSTTSDGLDFVAKAASRTTAKVNLRENIRTFAGLRAVAETDDFIIEEAPGAEGFFDLAGIKSPGLSSAPAIAEDVVRLMEQKGLPLTPRSGYRRGREQVRFKELDAQQKQELIAREPAFGRVICRCETITEGEILQALKSPVTPSTVDGVKRRCNAGMGRCQGGFCGPRVLEIIARERGISPLAVQKDRDGSFILTRETKRSTHKAGEGAE